MSLIAEQTGPADLVLLDGVERIAEIRGLKLTFARFRSGGKSLIGETFPLFLFWMQYANHEDPERNAGAGGKVEILARAPGQITLRCSGTTASGACSSVMLLTVRRAEDPARYLYTVRASLEVQPGPVWRVTPNPTQGEVEFANLWPEGTFSPDPGAPKKYQACYLATSAGVERIPHHHLETSDKHNIVMHRGDKFLWLREEENLCLTLLTEGVVTAGLCAYMWDAHFAFKICTEEVEVLLPAGSHYESGYELSSLDGNEATSIVARAADRPLSDLATIPLYVSGVNHFTQATPDAGADWRYIWPWEFEGGALSTAVFDKGCGHEDRSSLRIDSRGAGKSCWKVTTIGPPFGGEPFVDGSQYRLSAMVKTSKLEGKSMIAVRLHRRDRGSLFEIQNYETFPSDRTLQGEREWSEVKVTTPKISPPPDRLHLLLIQEGIGTTWFDEVFFEVLGDTRSDLKNPLR